MAHHLASLITEADTATGDTKAVAESRAADLVLRLWARRRDLPKAADPLGSYRDAIEVLSRLRPEQNPWRAFYGRGGVESLLAGLFDSLAKVVVSGILIVKPAKSHAVTPAEAAALTAEEQALLQQFAWWKAVVKPEPFQIEVYTSGQGETLDMALQTDESSVPGTDTGPESGCRTEHGEADTSREVPEPGENAASGSSRTSDQVTEALECLQAVLARLVEAWNAKPVED